jgi:hypothetical protein
MLTLNESAEGWTEVEKDGVRGIVPSSYVSWFRALFVLGFARETDANAARSKWFEGVSSW